MGRVADAREQRISARTYWNHLDARSSCPARKTSCWFNWLSSLFLKSVKLAAVVEGTPCSEMFGYNFVSASSTYTESNSSTRPCSRSS